MQPEGLRRRYLALLVPALAKVHAAHPRGSGQIARARAVRRAADSCLVEAISTRRTDHQQIRASAHRTCSSLHRSSFSCRLLRRAKAKAKSSFWRRRCIRVAASNQQIIDGLKANYRRPLGGSRADRRGTDSGVRADDERADCWIPDACELKRLQNALFPTAGDENSSDCTVINPAALLNQVAHYIIALQVQVDALQSLANLNI